MDAGEIEFGNENVEKMKMVVDWKESSDGIPRRRSLSVLFVFASRRRPCSWNWVWESVHQ